MTLSPRGPLLVIEPILTLIPWSPCSLFNQGSQSSPFRPLTHLDRLSQFSIHTLLPEDKVDQLALIILESRSPTAHLSSFGPLAPCVSPTFFNQLEHNSPICLLPYFARVVHFSPIGSFYLSYFLFLYLLFFVSYKTYTLICLKFSFYSLIAFMSLYFTCLFRIINVT